MSYQDFIAGKHRRPSFSGIDVTESQLNEMAFPFQRAIIKTSLLRGRAAIFADCGLGKSLMMLDWARCIVRHGNVGRALILCPVAVAPQMLREAEKFGIDVDCRVVAEGLECKPGINITNYEKLHKFDPSTFGAVALDEASILKSFAGKTKRMLCESFKKTKYKLAATATPAPNDHKELGNQADFLGIMPSNEMLSRWFINDTMKAGGYRLKGHAAGDFWDWMASWSVSIQKPSDIGFDDDGYTLPPMNLNEVTVESAVPAGQLFATGEAVSATSVHKEKRASLENKAEAVAELVNGNQEAWVCWVDTNYEADALRKLIPDAVEVRGSHPDAWKSERLMGFVDGKFRVLISKPEIAGFGLNFQHCCNTTYFAGFSFERWYQSVRRFYRFGQKRPVNVHLVASENEAGVLQALKRKQEQADEMSREMVQAMKTGMTEALHGRRELKSVAATTKIQIPRWLRTKEIA